MSLLTEIIVNGVTLDLLESPSMPLTFQINDLKDLDARTSDYSKTIKIPGTPRINQLFTHIYDINYSIQTSGIVNFSPDFNPNIKADCVAYSNGFEVFRGIMRLTDISVRDYTEGIKIEYEVILYGRLKSVYSALGDAELNQLTWSDLNHTYNKATQQATWSATPGTGYLYPMINYGVNSLAQSVSFNNSWDVNQFFPGVYLKEYVDRIFDYAGYTYTSSFFTSGIFKRLYVPFNKDSLKLTQAQIINRTFAASLSVASSGVVTTAGVTNTIPIDTESTDPGNVFNTATYKFTAPNTGFYSFQTQTTANIFAETTATNFQPTIGVRVTIDPVSGANISPAGASHQYPYQANLSGGAHLTSQVFNLNTGTIPLQAGDTVYVEVYALLSTLYSPTGTIGYRVTASTFANQVVNNGISEGDTVDVSAVIPEDIKCVDFLRSLFKMFNLMVEPDRSNPNNLYIEPAVDFYTSGGIVDWTRTLAIDQPMVIKPMGLLDAKRYLYKYKEDTDYYNKLYQDEYNEPYGTRTIDVQNDFVKGDKVTDIIFSPTPLEDNNTNDRIIPAIYYVSNSGQVQAKKSNIRILYYGGLLTTATGWTYTSAASGNSTETQYPYSGHLDSTTNPQFDLSFEPPRRVYYLANYYTDSNLYNNYHRQFVDEITDRNSKIVVAWLRLTPVDIHTLSFRNKVFIHDTYYRLQRIIDYDPSVDRLTKVELLKIKNGVPFLKTVSPIYDTPDYPVGTESHGTSTSAGSAAGESYTGGIPDGSLSSGVRNFISGQTAGVIVTGEYNAVHSGSRNIALISTSGVTVQAGASNVTAINTSGVTISNSNEVWINNMRQSSLVVSLGSAYTIYYPGTFYATGTFTVTLDPSLINEGEEITVKNISTGVITVNGGGVNIDGNPTQSLFQNDSMTIKKYNNQFYIL